MAENSYVGAEIGTIKLDVEHRDGEVEIASITGSAGSYEHVSLPRDTTSLRELGQLLIIAANQTETGTDHLRLDHA